MGSIEERLKALERQFSQHSGAEELDLFCDALAGDSEAAVELERLWTEGRTTSRLWELYDSVRYPVGAPAVESTRDGGLRATINPD